MNGKRRYKKHEIALKNKVTPAILAALSTAILTYVLYYVNFDLSYGQGASAILFASFGSSAFILFMTPRSKSAKISRFVKSYALAAILGALGLYLVYVMPLFAAVGIIVLILSLLMYALDSSHPPAVGIALAFVLYRMEIYGVLIVILGVMLLLFLRIVLERFVYIIEEDVVKEIER